MMSEASPRSPDAATPARILLVEDELNMARTLAKNLERAGYAVEHAPHGEAALARLESVTFDVVLTDLKMPVMDGMDLLRAMHERHIGAAAVVLTGYGTIESAVEAMKLGAADYLIKDARPQEILLTLERVLRLTSLKSENERLRREIGRLHGFGELIGQSASMEAVYRLIEAVSHNKSTVLLSGESGTGKELVARTVHQRSVLRDAPFVAINCAGLSETLLDSQLFGHRRGAFTGAVADHDGVFRAATGGTLLLDEVAEIPLGLQAKFLRAIQEREVTPLGSSRPVPVDVRLIAATNRDIELEVREARFRADLFYRLNVVHIELPPLRARRDDIPGLVEHFLARYSEQYQVASKRIAPDALAALVGFDWPGNIRQLQNVIERAFALSAADLVSLADLPPALRGGPAPESGRAASAPLQTLAEAERDLIAAALEKSSGNKNEAARLLGIDRQRLYRKIEKYHL
jgi:DNA-binding NtrC family response regulator